MGSNRYDPASVLMDILEEERMQRHLHLQQQYRREKSDLIGQTIPVTTRLYHQEWKVVDTICKTEENDGSCEYQNVGIRDFPFQLTPVKSHDGKYSRIRFLDLLIHMWPGDWKQQLKRLNQRIEESQQKEKERKRHGRIREILPISHCEFWIFWGIIICARLEGKKGKNMWDNTIPEGYGQPVTMAKYMLAYRFKQICCWMSYLFAYDTKREWRPIVAS